MKRGDDSRRRIHAFTLEVHDACDALVEVVGQSVEVVDQAELHVAGLLRGFPLTPALSRGARVILSEVFDDGLRMDLLLNVDRDGGDFQGLAVLLVFAAPNQLRIEVGVAGIAHGEGSFLLLGHEVSQLFGRDVRPLVLVPDGLDGCRIRAS
jgi:hypothetical protein